MDFSPMKKFNLKLSKESVYKNWPAKFFCVGRISNREYYVWALF
jgi:hypothetical protein